jgi:Na+/phosphate symporter
VALDIGNYRLILLIAGYVFLEFFPKKNWKKFGEILFGLGIILGANIGSCITGLIAALRLSSAARQASLAQIMITFLEY